MGRGRFLHHAPPDMLPAAGKAPFAAPSPDAQPRRQGSFIAVDDTAMTNSMQLPQPPKHEPSPSAYAQPDRAANAAHRTAGAHALLSREDATEVLSLCDQRLRTMLSDIAERLAALHQRSDKTHGEAAATAAAISGLSHLKGVFSHP